MSSLKPQARSQDLCSCHDGVKVACRSFTNVLQLATHYLHHLLSCKANPLTCPADMSSQLLIRSHPPYSRVHIWAIVDWRALSYHEMKVRGAECSWLILGLCFLKVKIHSMSDLKVFIHKKFRTCGKCIIKVKRTCSSDKEADIQQALTFHVLSVASATQNVNMKFINNWVLNNYY